jgi:plasmid stabilization system protein ParE
MIIPVVWTVGARQSFLELLAYLAQQPQEKTIARARDILYAIAMLTRAPTMCPVRHRCNGKAFRRLVVRDRFLVYYIYFPSSRSTPYGKVSIRGVKHGARRRPFGGVRDKSSYTQLAFALIRCVSC